MSIYLREIQRDDLAEINRWRNDKELVGFLGAPFRFVNKEVDDKWFDSYLSSRSNNVRLAICDSASSDMLGLVYLLHIDWLNRSCEYAIQIGKSSSHGHGVGYEATINILRHAFTDLNLHRIYLTVLASNHRAIKLYNKVGFSLEGNHRQAVFKNGQYLDLVQMSILSDEFRPDTEPPAKP